LWTWGCNDNGALGIGENIPYVSTPRLSKLKNVVSLSTGDFHTLAITKSGAVYSWGANECGQLGTGDYESRYEPTEIIWLRSINIIEVISGGNFSLACADDGYLQAWGYNNEGQIEMSPGGPVLKPKTVTLGNIRHVRNVVAGFHHAHAITKDGQAQASGYNNFGQLGLGDYDDRNQICDIKDLRGMNVIQIGVGENHSFALVD